jgi:hypothetical protein
MRLSWLVPPVPAPEVNDHDPLPDVSERPHAQASPGSGIADAQHGDALSGSGTRGVLAR